MSRKFPFLFKLNDGLAIPAIGYGTGTAWFKGSPGELDQTLVNNLETALESGFTHIDGAQIYNTSSEIGEAIANHKREDIFLTDKYNVAANSKITPYDALVDSLKNQLKTDYVDLYLLHSPFISKSTHGFDLVEAWKYLEKLVDDGYARSIGVSNFSVEDLQTILKSDYKIKPAVNQIEFNPYLQNQTPGIVEFSQKEGIVIEGYSPLGPLLKGKPGPIDDLVAKLASKYNKAEEQILLKYTIQREILPITTSSKESRIKSFLDITDFRLTQEEVDEISKLGQQKTLRQYWTKEYSKYD